MGPERQNAIQAEFFYSLRFVQFLDGCSQKSHAIKFVCYWLIHTHTRTYQPSKQSSLRHSLFTALEQPRSTMYTWLTGWFKLSTTWWHKTTRYVLNVVATLYFNIFEDVQQQQQRPFYGPLSGTTRVSRYQKKHSPTHHRDHHPIFISFFHLPRSIASSLFKSRAWQSFCTTSFHVLFGLPLGLEPSTLYSIHFFTQLGCGPIPAWWSPCHT